MTPAPDERGQRWRRSRRRRAAPRAAPRRAGTRAAPPRRPAHRRARTQGSPRRAARRSRPPRPPHAAAPGAAGSACRRRRRRARRAARSRRRTYRPARRWRPTATLCRHRAGVAQRLELQPSKLAVRVRFPSPAPTNDLVRGLQKWTDDWWTDHHPTGEPAGCCAPSHPRPGNRSASLDPSQPQFPIPRRVIEGGSHVGADEVLPALPAGGPSTRARRHGRSHIGSAPRSTARIGAPPCPNGHDLVEPTWSRSRFCVVR